MKKTPSAAPVQTAVPYLLPDLAAIRKASSLEDAIKLMTPSVAPRPDAEYTVVEPPPAPLPQKRGVSVAVYMAAARQTGAFKVGTIQAALSDKNAKNVAYWTRRLTTLGFFKLVS